jgi:hypothetical protein
MSAKNKKPARPAAPAATTAPAAAAVASKAADAPTTALVPALESSDPKRRMIAQIALIVFSLYVAAVWLLALDQQFHWGIFKP